MIYKTKVREETLNKLIKLVDLSRDDWDYFIPTFIHLLNCSKLKNVDRLIIGIILKETMKLENDKMNILSFRLKNYSKMGLSGLQFKYNKKELLTLIEKINGII